LLKICNSDRAISNKNLLKIYKTDYSKSNNIVAKSKIKNKIFKNFSRNKFK